MKLSIIIIAALISGCIIPRTAEDRCINAGLTVTTMKIHENESFKQKVDVECSAEK